MSDCGGKQKGFALYIHFGKGRVDICELIEQKGGGDEEAE